jgi:RimJ/RimL family protein N-acetyltransferase
MGLLTEPVVAAGSMAGQAQPAIDGDGVVLRPWRAGDLAVVLAGYGDPAIQQWHARSMDEAEARAWIARWPGRWSGETGAGWVVTREGDEAVGQISLNLIDLHEGLGRLSYWTLPSARGAGYAPRALDALAGWVFGRLGLYRLELSHSTANVASCRVATKAGFAAEGTKRGYGWHPDGWHDMHLHGRLATDSPSRP